MFSACLRTIPIRKHLTERELKLRHIIIIKITIMIMITITTTTMSMIHSLTTGSLLSDIFRHDFYVSLNPNKHFNETGI